MYIQEAHKIVLRFFFDLTILLFFFFSFFLIFFFSIFIFSHGFIKRYTRPSMMVSPLATLIIIYKNHDRVSII